MDQLRFFQATFWVLYGYDKPLNFIKMRIKRIYAFDQIDKEHIYIYYVQILVNNTYMYMKQKLRKYLLNEILMNKEKQVLYIHHYYFPVCHNIAKGIIISSSPVSIYILAHACSNSLGLIQNLYYSFRYANLNKI